MGKAILDWFAYFRDASPVVGSPAVAGTTVYIGGTDGIFYGLDSESGKAIWRHNLGAPVISSPAIADNTVYIAAFDGTVYAFTEWNGKETGYVQKQI